MSKICLLAACVASAFLTFASFAETTKASSWKGRVVVTPNGELLGRIEDLAVDVEAQQVKFVVVSIGSFLVEDNLIAIAPDAIGPSEDGRYLVVYSDQLANARRFGAESWPAQPDVLASAERRGSMPEISAEAADKLAADNRSSSQRTATISDGRRTATMVAGDRTAKIDERQRIRPETAKPAKAVQPKRFQGAGPEPLVADSEFDRLDENSDGYLSRSEIGPRLQSNVRYDDYDLDGNEGIDLFEFQLLKQAG